MRSLLSVFLVTTCFYSIAWAQRPGLQSLDKNTAFQDLAPRAATALEDFFGAVSFFSEGLYLSQPDLGFAPFHFTRIVQAQKTERCPAILCADSELFERIAKEVKDKRLVLFTHAFNPFNGVALYDTPAVVQLKTAFPDADANKNGIIASPNLNLYSFEHELFHTRDFEAGTLAPFSNEIGELLKSQKISRKLAQAARSLVREVRAYDLERRLLLSPRATEFQINATKARATMEIEVQEVSGSTFAANQLTAIDQQVKSVLAFQFAKELVGVDEDVRALLLNRMRDLLPSDGPYSLKNLGLEY